MAKATVKYNTKTVASTLESARKLIKSPKSWIKGDETNELENGDMQYCMIGAMNEVDGPLEEEAISLMIATIWMHTDQKFTEIERYNDDDGTEHADVMAMFQTAIKTAKTAYTERVRKALKDYEHVKEPDSDSVDDIRSFQYGWAFAQGFKQAEIDIFMRLLDIQNI